MPEGFSSVADLKVIVDASTEKFHSGLQGVNSMLNALESSSGRSLSGLDNMLQMVGNATLGVSGKVKLAMAAIEAGIGMYQQFAQEGRKAAEALGVTTEYDRLTATIDDLGMNIKDATVGAFFALTSAGTETANSMMSFASSTDAATDSADSFASKLLVQVTQALDSARLQLRLWNSDLAGNAGQINTTVDLLDTRLAKLRIDLAKMQSGDTASQLSIATRGGGTQTLDLEKKLRDEINKLEADRNDLLAKRASLPGQDWADGTVTSKNLLNDEIEALERKNATLGMSAGKAAEYNMMQKMIAQAERDGLVMSDQQLASMRAEAAEFGRKTQAADDYAKSLREAQAAKQRGDQLDRTELSIVNNAERELLGLQQRGRAYSMTAGEAAELNMQERLLMQLRTAGIPVDEAQVVRINAIAAAARQQTEALAETAAQMQQMNEIGNVVSGNLRSAFSSWTNGAKTDVKDMVASMIADFAQLSFQRNVLDTLFGSSSSGGSNSGGAFGSFMSSIFGGFRADGGDVTAGKAYVVGERGPEWFLPGQSGAIIPNGVAPGGQPVQIITHIDARGATSDAIAELREVMAQRDAALPGQVLSVMQNARDRVLV